MPLPTEAEFDSALDRLNIRWVDGQGAEIGPLVDTVTTLVAEFVGCLIDANPALAAHLQARLASAPVIAGVRSVRLSGLRDDLELTAVHGRPAGPPVLVS